MRFYITLNENKEKDKLIIDLLEKQYNAKDYVTALLYQYATNCTDLHLSASICTDSVTDTKTESVQNVPNCTNSHLSEPKRIENNINNIGSTVQNAPFCIETVQNLDIEISDDIMNMFK